MFGQQPVHEAAGRGRRALCLDARQPGRCRGAAGDQTELRTKSRDLVRRNAWAQCRLEAFVANAIGTGIKPQSLAGDDALRERIRRCGATGRRKPMPPGSPISTVCRRLPAGRCSKAVNA
jgi:capsid protein